MIMYFLRFSTQHKMDATKLITPSDTKSTVHRTHMFLIVNMVIIMLALGGFVGWLFYAKNNKKFPYEKYTRTTGPPGTNSMKDMNFPNQGKSSSDTKGSPSSTNLVKEVFTPAPPATGTVTNGGDSSTDTGSTTTPPSAPSAPSAPTGSGGSSY